MSTSELSIIGKVKLIKQDPIMTEEREAQSRELRGIKTIDNKISQFLNSECCDVKETAQFFYYLASEACTSVCRTIDIPSKNEWGGWYQSEFLIFYTRSLFETIDRISKKQDRLLHDPDILHKELQIAKQSFQSARERNLLESRKNNLDAVDKQYIGAVANKKRLQEFCISIRDQHREGKSRLSQNEKAIQSYEASCQSYKKKINKFQADHDGYQVDEQFHRNLNVLQIYLARQQNLLTASSAQNRNIRLSLQDLVSQYSAQQTAMKAQEVLVQKMQQAQAIADKAFNDMQESCIQNLMKRVSNLKKGEHYCHAAGFKGHAIYINFQNLGDKIETKICNLGAGRNYHPLIQSQPELCLPVVLHFNRDKPGQENLNGFCQSVTKAITAKETEATRLIYQSGYGKCLTKEEYNEYYAQGMITAELGQITGNCTAKGYFQALRERISNSDSYANLMFSLFAWSKNLYFLRKEQTPVNNVLVTSDDLAHLRKSEAVFKNKNDSWFESRINGLTLTALAALPVQPRLPQELAGFKSRSAMPLRPPVLTAFPHYSFSDSQVSKSAISEDALFAHLHYK